MIRLTAKYIFSPDEDKSRGGIDSTYKTGGWHCKGDYKLLELALRVTTFFLISLKGWQQSSFCSGRKDDGKDFLVPIIAANGLGFAAAL